MGKLTEAFAMTRRQRQGMTVVVIVLAASLFWLWTAGNKIEPISEQEAAEMQRFAHSTDSLLAAQATADSLRHAERLRKQQERDKPKGEKGAKKASKHSGEKAPTAKRSTKTTNSNGITYDPNLPVDETTK